MYCKLSTYSGLYCSQKTDMLAILKPQLQDQLTTKRPDQYDHFQGSTYINPCSVKTDILVIFKACIKGASNYLLTVAKIGEDCEEQYDEHKWVLNNIGVIVASSRL